MPFIKVKGTWAPPRINVCIRQSAQRQFPVPLKGMCESVAKRLTTLLEDGASQGENGGAVGSGARRERAQTDDR